MDPQSVLEGMLQNLNRRPGEQLLPWEGPDGYDKYCLVDGHDQRRAENVHEFTWNAYHGVIPEGYAVGHKDGNVHHNWPLNLELRPASLAPAPRAVDAQAQRLMEGVLQNVNTPENEPLEPFEGPEGDLLFVVHTSFREPGLEWVVIYACSVSELAGQNEG